MTTQDKLTPEILMAAGWKKEGESSISVSYSIDLDEDFGKDETDFSAFMMIVFRKLPNINERHILFDIERTLGDRIRSDFKRNITVGEFNTLLDIVKLNKFQIK